MWLMIGTMGIDENINMDGPLTPAKKIELRLIEEKLLKATRKNGIVEYTENGVTFTFQDRLDKAADVHMLIKVRIELRIRKTFDNA
jgi:RNA-binding protein YhbY